jgi:hypothetical protein
METCDANECSKGSENKSTCDRLKPAHPLPEHLPPFGDCCWPPGGRAVRGPFGIAVTVIKNRQPTNVRDTRRYDKPSGV